MNKLTSLQVSTSVASSLSSAFLLVDSVGKVSGVGAVVRRLMSAPLVVIVAILVMAVSPKAVAAGADGKTIRYDVGASTGKSGDDTYTEANIAISYFFLENVSWRNSVFARFQSETKDRYGLDSSIRASLSTGDAQNGASIFVAPGYRFVSDGEVDPAPFGEAGLTFRAGGISIGGGVKTIFYKVIDSAAENETQYFVTLGGGGGF